MNNRMNYFTREILIWPSNLSLNVHWERNLIFRFAPSNTFYASQELYSACHVYLSATPRTNGNDHRQNLNRKRPVSLVSVSQDSLIPDSDSRWLKGLDVYFGCLRRFSSQLWSGNQISNSWFDKFMWFRRFTFRQVAGPVTKFLLYWKDERFTCRF